MVRLANKDSLLLNKSPRYTSTKKLHAFLTSREEDVQYTASSLSSFMRAE